jgi:pimeloyl-ACP methyl ester carboxylesterase
LHGLNSDPGTWKDLIGDRSGFGYCDHLKAVGLDPYRAVFYRQINNQESSDSAQLDQPPNGCYALEFGSRMVDGEIWDNGDGLDYEKLGGQVKAAVQYIVAQRNPLAIVMVGHSRGGLAARAFLQQYSSRDELEAEFGLNKVGLVTVGTPHQGSPFGRIKWWMDDQGKTWRNTLDSTIAVLGAISLLPVDSRTAEQWAALADSATQIREKLKFVFSPSVANMATYHNSSGTLQLCADPVAQAMCILNDQTRVSRLADVVTSAGQIVSKGLALGENVIYGLNVLTSWGPDVGWILPGGSDELRNYVFENLPEGHDWRANTDSIVPAESQRLDLVAPALAPMLAATTRYLDKINHVSELNHDDETGQTDCINQVLNDVVNPLVGLAMPSGQMGTALLSAQPSVRATRTDEQDSEPRTRDVRRRVLRMSASDLVEAAIEGVRANTLEGLVSRREIRERDEAGQREIVTQLRQRLARPDQATRARAVGLLSEVPAEYSAETVLEVLGNETDAGVRQAALKTLRTLAAEAPTQASRRYLSESLRRMVRQSAEMDPEVFLATVDGLVALGGAVEVEQLMDLYRRSDVGRKQLLAARMGALRNGEGAQRLAAYLAEDPELQQERTRVAGEVLSEMSTVESVSGLLDWARQIEAEPQRAEAVRWLKRVRTTRGKARLAEVVKQSEFRSTALQQSLEEVMANPGQCSIEPATPILGGGGT